MSPLTRAHAQRLRAQGVSLRAIAQRHGLSYRQVRHLCGSKTVDKPRARKYPALAARVTALDDPDLMLSRCARADWPERLQERRGRLERGIAHFRDSRKWTASFLPWGPWETEIAAWVLGVAGRRDEQTALAKLEALAVLGCRWFDDAKSPVVPRLPVGEDVAPVMRLATTRPLLRKAVHEAVSRRTHRAAPQKAGPATKS